MGPPTRLGIRIQEEGRYFPGTKGELGAHPQRVVLRQAQERNDSPTEVPRWSVQVKLGSTWDKRIPRYGLQDTTWVRETHDSCDDSWAVTTAMFDCRTRAPRRGAEVWVGSSVITHSTLRPLGMVDRVMYLLVTLPSRWSQVEV